MDPKDEWPNLWDIAPVVKPKDIASEASALRVLERGRVELAAGRLTLTYDRLPGATQWTATVRDNTLEVSYQARDRSGGVTVYSIFRGPRALGLPEGTVLGAPALTLEEALVRVTLSTDAASPARRH